jgi:hypothetical protein
MRLLNARYLNEEFDESVFSNAQRLSFAIPALEGLNPAERQRFLEMTSAAERLRRGIEALERILDRVQLTQQIERIISGNGHPPGSVLQKLFAGKGQKGD